MHILLQTLLSLVVVIVFVGFLVLFVYFFNRSRVPLEEAIKRTGISRDEVRELIQRKYLSDRRKYLIAGPRSLDIPELESTHKDYLELQRVQADFQSAIRKAAEETAAKIAESNRRFEEEMRATQEEFERVKRASEDFLRQLRQHLELIPPEVVAALQTLGLSSDATLDQVRQQYRTLAKRYHPDAGGDPRQFIQVDTAYKQVISWIQEQRTEE